MSKAFISFYLGFLLLLAAGGSADLQAGEPKKKPPKTVQTSALKTVPPPPPVSIFGIQMDYQLDDSGLQQTVAAGAHWLRFDAFDWDRIEPQSAVPAVYRWDQVDEAGLQRAAQKGLEIIAVVKYVPEWARKHPESGCGPIRPEALGRFAKFLSALVKRYKGPPYNIKYWELGNEPDAPIWPGRVVYGCWGDQNDPYFGGAQYAQMLKAAFPAIKAADPEARVLLGGLLLDNPKEDPHTMARFLEGILKGGGGAYFDLLSFHGYSYFWGTAGLIRNHNWPGSGTSVTERIAFIKNVLKRYGLTHKPLINTEVALYCDADTPECLETQAIFIPRAYAEGIAAGLQAVIYYVLISDFRNIGLLRWDSTPRPSYRAYQTASSFLTKARYAGPPTGYPPGITGFSFVPPTGGFLDLVWSRDGAPTPVTLPPGSSAFDRYGSPLDSSSDPLAVGYGPVYIKKP